MKTIYLNLLFVYFSSVCLAQVRAYKATVYDSTSTGYYFLSSNRAFGVKGINDQMILDHNGDLVFYMPFPDGQVSFDWKLQPNGMISYFYGSKFYLMDSTFTIKDSIEGGNGLRADLHDLQILPNGHYLLMAPEIITMDLSSYAYFKNGA